MKCFVKGSSQLSGPVLQSLWQPGYFERVLRVEEATPT